MQVMLHTHRTSHIRDLALSLTSSLPLFLTYRATSLVLDSVVWLYMTAPLEKFVLVCRSSYQWDGIVRVVQLCRPMLVRKPIEL